MTILLYDHYQLEERASSHLKVWKAWHLVLYTLAAVFGIMNYIFLQNTMTLVDNNCVLYPRRLEFHMVDVTEIINSNNDVDEEAITEVGNVNNVTAQPNSNDTVVTTSNNAPTESKDDVGVTTSKNATGNAQFNSSTVHNSSLDKANVKREVIEEDVPQDEDTANESNETVTGNLTHQLFLDTSRTLFSDECEFAEYMPIVSTVFACVWATMFTMCAGGGRARTGLQQPWRILAPALLFAVVMVGLTGRSFTDTNEGLHAFCAGFFNLTNSTTCSSLHEYLERGGSSAWTMGGRISATKAASAGMWASWACAAALLLARCLAAPDFQVKKTGAYLVKDPQMKVTPYLKKQRSNRSSPSKRDTASMRSDPTITTELVTASVEQGQDTLPSSLTVTPLRTPRNQEVIEMTYSPQEIYRD